LCVFSCAVSSSLWTGSSPHIGTQDSLETVEEWRVEINVDEAVIHDVISALKENHPYETPAYDDKGARYLKKRYTLMLKKKKGSNKTIDWFVLTLRS
jgi:uncharacterized protein involved in tolerance to divalent cations